MIVAAAGGRVRALARLRVGHVIMLFEAEGAALVRSRGIALRVIVMLPHPAAERQGQEERRGKRPVVAALVLTSLSATAAQLLAAPCAGEEQDSLLHLIVVVLTVESVLLVVHLHLLLAVLAPCNVALGGL